MNGGHDLGGMHGLGSINPEPETSEPVFHAQWEQRVFALTLTSGFLGRWNLDMSRFARERQHPANYIANSYYENWLAGLLTLLDEQALVTKAELAAGRTQTLDTAVRVLEASQVSKTLGRGSPATLPVPAVPLYSVGDTVRVRNFHPQGHTRAPRYVRGHTGVVQRHHGGHIFPDAHADGVKTGQHLYSVRFTAQELWGIERKDIICLDLWESYLNYPDRMP